MVHIASVSLDHSANGLRRTGCDGCRFKRGDTDQRPARCHRETFGGGHTNSDAGEPAGADTDRKEFDILKISAGFVK
jgi:hypothetical protein